MKRLFHVSFGYYTPQAYVRFRRILDHIGVNAQGEQLEHGGYQQTFEEGHPSLEPLLEELEGARREIPDGFTRFVREERVYTSQELLAAELLNLTSRGQVGSGGDYYGTQFDESHACPICGAGLVQTSDLIIDKKEMGKKDIAHTYQFEYVITDHLAQIFKEHSLSGLGLRAVRHRSKRMRHEPQLWQLIATHTLPPMASPTSFYRSSRYCSNCGQTGLFLRRTLAGVDVAFSEIYYRRADLEVTGVKDFNATYECFGETKFAKSLLIISQRVYRVLKENRVRSFDVEPVNIIE